MNPPQREIGDESAFALELIERIVASCPRRRPGSDDERRAHEMVAEQLASWGLAPTTVPFEFCDNLYRVIALHFGVGTLGSLLARRSPPVALLLHLLGAAYWAESTHRAAFASGLLPQRHSQNVLATLRADTADPALRIVVPAHIDAGFHGLLFQPRIAHRFGSLHTGGGILERPLALATAAQIGLAGLDLVRLLRGRSASPLLTAALTLPGLAACALSAEVALRDQTVPGANDDLSGVAGALLLAQRLATTKPANVEIVFAVTGAEEAGLGGARALAASGRWDPSDTVVIGLDGLTNGGLHYFVEGELEPARVPDWIAQALDSVISSDPRYAEVQEFAIPVGCTDVYAFRRQGFDGVCLGCVDPASGAPEHYHLPTDTPDHLDMAQLMRSVDFAEQLILAIAKRGRVG